MIARFILILGTLPLCSVLAQEITMTLSPEECAPGDLVRLSFQLESEAFTEMAISYLSPEGIHPVVNEKRPIEFQPPDPALRANMNTGSYKRCTQVSFLFSDLTVTLEGLVELEPIKIGAYAGSRVTGFTETEDSPTPEVWPPYLEKQEPSISLALGYRHDRDLLCFSID
jgi:hypothetical protein